MYIEVFIPRHHLFSEKNKAYDTLKGNSLNERRESGTETAPWGLFSVACLSSTCPESGPFHHLEGHHGGSY